MDRKLISMLTDVMSGMVARSIENNLKDILKNALITSIQANTSNEVYWNIIDLLLEMDKELYMNNADPAVETIENTPTLLLGTQYIIKIDLLNYIVVKFDIDEKNHAYMSKKITIFFVGNQCKLNRHKFIKLLKNMRNRDNRNKIKLMTINYGMTEHILNAHSFDRIVLEKEVRRRIIYGLYNWYKSKDWYTQHKLMHKIGVLLYGEPGTGKTSIAQAISSMFGNVLITITHDKINESLTEIFYFRKSFKGIMIILFEDFDLFFKDRDDREVDKNSQYTLMQILDGIYSTEDTIYIATTNYIDKLDPAVRRYGRFDIQEEIKIFDKERTIEYLKLFGYDESFISNDKEAAYNPAVLQSRVMQDRAMKIYEEKKYKNNGE